MIFTLFKTTQTTHFSNKHLLQIIDTQPKSSPPLPFLSPLIIGDDLTTKGERRCYRVPSPPKPSNPKINAKPQTPQTTLSVSFHHLRFMPVAFALIETCDSCCGFCSPCAQRAVQRLSSVSPSASKWRGCDASRGATGAGY